MFLPQVAGPLHHSYRPACSGRIGCNLDAFRTTEFRRAVGIGVITAVAIAALRLLLSRSPGRRGQAMNWGWIAVVAVVGALAASRHLLPSTALGLALLIVAGAAADRLRPPPLAHLAILVPGAVVLCGAPALRAIVPQWARILAIVVTVAAGYAGQALDTRPELGSLSPVLYAITALGLYAVVPDTDFALVLGGVLIPIAILCVARPDLTVGSAGSAGLSGSVCLVALVGGYGRPSAIVGGIACLGLIAVAPFAVTLMRRARVRHDSRVVSAVVAVHLVLVWYAARVSGRQPFPRRAFTVWLVGEVVVAAVAISALRPRTAARP